MLLLTRIIFRWHNTFSPQSSAKLSRHRQSSWRLFLLCPSPPRQWWRCPPAGNTGSLTRYLRRLEWTLTKVRHYRNGGTGMEKVPTSTVTTTTPTISPAEMCRGGGYSKSSTLRGRNWITSWEAICCQWNWERKLGEKNILIFRWTPVTWDQTSGVLSLAGRGETMRSSGSPGSFSGPRQTTTKSVGSSEPSGSTTLTLIHNLFLSINRDNIADLLSYC